MHPFIKIKMAEELEILSDEERAIVGKIPIGHWCYGSTLEDKGEVINGKLEYKTVLCPYFKDTHYCSYLKMYDEFMPDVKFCNIKKYYKFFGLEV